MFHLLECSPIAQFAIGLDHKITVWNKACELLTGFSAKEMLDGGLVLQRKSGSGHYDRFRNRVMFPITLAVAGLFLFRARREVRERDEG